MPTFSFSGRRRPIHPSPYLALVPAPPPQQRCHLPPAHDNPSDFLTNCLSYSSFYPPPMRVSPWLWFRRGLRDPSARPSIRVEIKCQRPGYQFRNNLGIRPFFEQTANRASMGLFNTETDTPPIGDPRIVAIPLAPSMLLTLGAHGTEGTGDHEPGSRHQDSR